MRKKYTHTVTIPEGTECTYTDGTLSCKKGETTLQRQMNIPGTIIQIQDQTIAFTCAKANKKDMAIIRTHAAHAQNLIEGTEKEFTYELEICNVHFPITAKVEGNTLIISNFLGEKVNRTAAILPTVTVNVQGQKITVSGHDIEKTGQTAANIEKAAKVTGRDRRIFQDGIFMTSKPGGAL